MILPRSPGRHLLPILLILAATACPTDVEQEGKTIGRDQFVAAYVDLRLESLRSDRTPIPPETRDSILATHHLTPADLLAFVEHHGRNVAYMNAIWSEIDTRITEAAP
jgi:hypothetical protein